MYVVVVVRDILASISASKSLNGKLVPLTTLEAEELFNFTSCHYSIQNSIILQIQHCSHPFHHVYIFKHEETAGTIEFPLSF